MGANVWPVDAVSGAPSYTGRLLRQLAGLVWARNPARPLAAASGVVLGTPSTIATCPTPTTYQVTPFGGVIDGEASAVAGAYSFSFDSNQTGAVNAADATNPRIDLLYVRVSDPAEGDGSAAPLIELLYVAGTAAASPVVPSTPARSMPLATILVPKVGAGSPVVTFAAPTAAAAGAVNVCATSATYPATPYVGQYVHDVALKGLVQWTGTVWRPVTTDSGWVNVTALSGFTSNAAQVRMEGTKVKGRGSITRNAGAFPAAGTGCGTLPAGFDPGAEFRGSSPAFASSTPDAMGILIGSGSLTIQGFSIGAGIDTVYLACLDFYTD